MIFDQLISKRIRDLCKEHRITINKLAKMSGVRQSTINSILKGKVQNPGGFTIAQIALGGFGLTNAEFMDFPEMNDFTLPDTEDTDDWED